MQRIKGLINEYKANMDRQTELNDKLLENLERDEWIACLQQRAKEVNEMFQRNQEIIEEMEHFLAGQLDDKSAEVLYDELSRMYLDGYDDCFFLLPITYRLISYYEEKQDIQNLMFLYGVVYYEENEIRNRRSGHYDSMSLEYMYKVIDMRKYYAQLSNEKIRRRIFAAYYNIVVVGLNNMAVEIDDAFNYYNEMIEFWNSEEVQRIDGNNSDMRELVERISYELLSAEEHIHEASYEVEKAYCAMATQYYEKAVAVAEDITDVNSEVYGAYLHALVIEKKKSFDDIIEEYLDYYEKKLARTSLEGEISDDDFYFIINTPMKIESWLAFIDSEETKNRVIHVLKRRTDETWYIAMKDRSEPFANEILTSWCFKVLKYLDGTEEEQDWLFRLLVQRQLPTYLHSVMVMHLAEALFKEAVRKRPELFAGLPEKERNSTMDFVRQCALLHDIGKTRITDITNTQGRQLADHEFQAIRKHPGYGAEMLEKDRSLSKYHDVAMGHHKFYDGKGGYPMEFDNTGSPYRIIIDLITICDCIDAATDHLGRNYKRAKSLEEVLAELVEGSGTRYNPELVAIIQESPRLRREMDYITGEGRTDSMYRAYLERI